MSGYDLLVLRVGDMRVGDKLMLIREGAHIGAFRTILEISAAPKKYGTEQMVLKLEHWSNDIWLYPNEDTVVARLKEK